MTGCGLDGPVPSERKHEQAAVPKPEPSVATDKAGDKKPAGAATDRPAGKPAVRDKTAGTRPTDVKAASGQAPGTVRNPAAVGMGEKGRGYGNGYIGVTLHAFWGAREMITLDQIKHEMNIYKAAEGHYPKDMNEFTEKILKPANIKLPFLPQNHHYIYDPTSEEFLMVEAPEMGDQPSESH
jgi:hypothetical protein